MKTVYIDSEFKCHTTNPDGTFREIETSIFGGKCQGFIEGNRFVPSGESWISEDGTVFRGKMKFPWKNYDLLEAAQTQYEADLAEAAAAYQEGVNAAYDQ